MQEKGKCLRILICGGGTGGHIFPALALAETFLEKYNCDIRFVGTAHGMEVEEVPKMGFRLYCLPVSGLYRVGFKKKFLSLLKLPLAFINALGILLSFRPHIVIGVGGYASGPILLLSLLTARNTVIQEQNAYPGMTNRLLGKWVPLSFVPFEGLEDVFKNPVPVGNPIRKLIRTAAGKVVNDQPAVPFVITLLGGSQGARILNQTLVEVLPQLIDFAGIIKIIHQTGKTDKQWVLKAYNKLPTIQTEVIEFIDDMPNVYLKSHVIFCRSGSIINEIIAMGKASILVPYPDSSGEHQLRNAQMMAAKKAAIVIEQKDLTPELLLQQLITLIKNPKITVEMGKNAKSMDQGDSAALIINKIHEFYHLSRFI